MLTVPLLICLIGWLVWLFFSRPVPTPHWTHSVFARTGEIMFAVGLFWVLSGLAQKVLY